MDSETIEGFSKYRLNKAKETLETARMIFMREKILQALIIEHIMRYFML